MSRQTTEGNNKLLSATASVGSMTLLSRLLGFARDVIIARVLGAGMGADAFFVAFKIPNTMRRLFAEGAFSQAFIPVLSETKAKGDKKEVKDLVDACAGTLGGILLLVTLLGIILSPLIIPIFAPGFLQSQDKYDLAVSMLRITFPYLLFISLTALAGGILNTYGIFKVPAFTPVLLNLSLITAAIAFAPEMEHPGVALAISVAFAGVIQLLFQFPFLGKLKLLPRPKFRWHHSGVKRIRRLMLPTILSSSVAQINLIIDTLIASFLVTGSISWLYYSDRLVEFPLGVFGIALATVMLPSLSQHHATSSHQEFNRTLDWALRWVFILAVPAAVGLAALSTPIMATLFNYGEFGRNDVLMSSRSLIGYSIGLLGFILVKVLITGFYSRQETRAPVRIALFALGSNLILNIILVFPLAHMGLALATSASALLNAFLLYRKLRKDQVYDPLPGWLSWVTKVFISTLMMTLALFYLTEDPAIWFEWDWLERLWHLSLYIITGAIVYCGTLLCLGIRPGDLKLSSD